MYYPILRGRQFELIALREYAEEHGGINNITPIIEPVKDTYNSFNIAVDRFFKNEVKFSVILNPSVGDSKNSDLIANVSKLNDLTAWIPAFHYDSANFSKQHGIINSYGLKDLLIICSASINIDDLAFGSLIESGLIRYLVFHENRSLKRRLNDSSIHLIRLDDNFNGQKRNADYKAIPDEKFSEEHLFYDEEGFEGFSDYTILSSEYTEGGLAPYAIAIHLSYVKENGEIWIRHFVSDSNTDRSNIQGKFAEAARKAVEFLNSMNIHTVASEELREYVKSETYPGLGTIKKISIKNHLELVNQLLAKPL